MLKNVQFFLKKNSDPYGLLKDRQFSDLLTKLISLNHYSRPNVKEVLNSKFLQKWL